MTGEAATLVTDGAVARCEDTTTPDAYDAAQSFEDRRQALFRQHEAITSLSNEREALGNGIITRFRHPVVTAAHIPLEWRYDFHQGRNPHLMERLAVNAAFNAGALRKDGQWHLVVRVEGADRKSFCARARSATGTDRFLFDPEPIDIPSTEDPDVNIYDMRLTEHEDGWVYGLFCTERHDPLKPDDPTAAVARCGIARTRDLVSWERLPDLETPNGSHQRNVVLHPQFVDGQYGMYTRPQDGFVKAGAGGGIAWGLVRTMDRPVVDRETVIEPRRYHTIQETKNGLGPAPLPSSLGWLHLAHGVRTTAAGLRYVLYMFVTDLEKPWIVTHRPGGYLLAPEGEERVGDVSNVVFSNGWAADDDGAVHIFYGSSDTRLHVATSSIEKLVDYCQNTLPDSQTSQGAVAQRNALIVGNRSFTPTGA